MNKTLVKSAGIIALVAVPFFVLAQTMSQGPVTVTVAPMATSTCPVAITYLKAGINNNRDEVIRLQTFLKSYESADVDVNGTFDAKTDAAVRAFQKKYMSDIMAPWGATRASGIVRFTTVKKINQIACSIPLSLNPSELVVIDQYKKNLGTNVASVGSAVLPTSVPTMTSTPTQSPVRPTVVAPTAPVAPAAPTVTRPPTQTPTQTTSATVTASPSIEPLPVNLGPVALEGSTATDTDSTTTPRTSAARRFVNFLRNLF